ncbi:hypothetical protein H4219_005675 [Mycoemilia scoparia]|uniref:ATP synthase subunit g, mitochondrial n=1 Tax=Mycoemilia scoparia TaxID=417184 RepID=A0A9W7ZS99_9FUNG|nr:hypothetical protein H4219_005675 [Mycoemilia scoparia]
MASRILTTKAFIAPTARLTIRQASSEASAQKIGKTISDAANQVKSSVNTEKLNETAQKVGQQVKDLDLPGKAQSVLRTLCNIYNATINALPKGALTPFTKIGGAIQPITYWSQVAFHVAKQTAYRQNIAFPTKADFNTAQTELFKLLNTLAASNAFKQAPTQEQVKKGALLTFELVSFFIVGEQIGRRNLVGYKNH